MKKLIIAATFLTGASVGAAALAASESQPGWSGDRRGPPACAIYEHINFEGDARVFGRDAGHQDLGGRWNDRISSLRCRPGCQLTAYEHVEGRGAFFLYGGEVRNVGAFWNDKISSIRINCAGPDLGGNWGWDEGRGRSDGWGPDRDRRPACTYYEHINYQGRRETIRDGAELRAMPTGWNDIISSVQCRPGCELSAYEHVDYRGAQQRYRGDTAFVGPQWNDRISALRARCR